MLIKTTRFGELEVDESKVLFFPAGLPGLPGSRRYLLLDIAEQRPFRWLQSCDEPEIALVVVDPLLFFPDYRVEVSAEELNALGLEVEPEDACEVLAVLVVPPDPRLITANLLAPLIINHRSRRGAQVILSNSPYTTRHYLFAPEGKPEEKKVAEAAGGPR